MKRKRCATCRRNLPLKRYGTDKTRRDGHAYSCKRCRNKHARQHYRENRQTIIERRYELHGGRCKTCGRDWLADGLTFCSRNCLEAYEWAIRQKRSLTTKNTL